MDWSRRLNSSSHDFLYLVVSRDQVESMDLAPTLEILQSLIKSPESAKAYFERVDIAFDGYNDHPDELHEIVAVREFIDQLDRQFPYWLFFLSKHHLGLHCLLYSLLPPFLTPEARARIYPERIQSILVDCWFPAMNHICENVGFTDDQIDQLDERVMEYIAKGPLRS